MQKHTRDDPLPDPHRVEVVEADDCDAVGIVAFDTDGSVLGSLTCWKDAAVDVEAYR